MVAIVLPAVAQREGDERGQLRVGKERVVDLRLPICGAQVDRQRLLLIHERAGALGLDAAGELHPQAAIRLIILDKRLALHLLGALRHRIHRGNILRVAAQGNDRQRVRLCKQIGKRGDLRTQLAGRKRRRAHDHVLRYGQRPVVQRVALRRLRPVDRIADDRVRHGAGDRQGKRSGLV